MVSLKFHDELSKIERTELERIEMEKVNGVPYENFTSLINLSYEFHSMYNEQDLLSLWLDYRINIELGNKYHTNPDIFPGWYKIVGEEYMEDVLNSGGAFLTWHYGDYRHTIIPMKNQLQKLQKTMNLVVDSESFKHNKNLEKWESLRNNSNIAMLNSQDASMGIVLYKELQKGNCINLFLDGHTGTGKDNHILDTNLLNSRIRVRSGIFRIMALVKKPISIVIATRDKENNPILVFHKPVYINKDSIDETNNQFHRIFEKYLVERPGLWRHWFRHHKYIINANISSGEYTEPSDIHFFLKERPELKLCLKSGKLLKKIL